MAPPPRRGAPWWFILVAIFAPLIVKVAGAHPPNDQNKAVLDSFGQGSGPQSGYLFGTDDLGRDVFSRVIFGARTSVFIGFAAVALSVCARKRPGARIRHG